MANKNKNIIARLQHWMESVAGQTFLNYAYSWGAAVVILGTLFKLTHIAGANAMLFIGMGTEVFVFFLSGFDRPAILKEREEKEKHMVVADESEEEAGNEYPENVGDIQPVAPDQSGVAMAGQPVAQPMYGGGTVIIGGGMAPAAAPAGEGTAANVATGTAEGASCAAQPMAGNGQPFDMKLLAEMVNASNAEFLEAARNACAPEMQEAAEAYVEELKKLTETLTRVSEQAECMTRDSKEMDNLNRTLTGINTIYEMQLKSISTQVTTIDQINDQTRKMARQIEELNGIYNRMIQALTVNMKQNGGGASVG